ncbi:MAG: small subunit ribosomal protein S9, partial [Marivirga sp.]
MEVINTIGRRKTSVARLYLQAGKGNIVVNTKELKEYFPTEVLQTIVKQPLVTSGTEGTFDIKINV